MSNNTSFYIGLALSTISAIGLGYQLARAVDTRRRSRVVDLETSLRKEGNRELTEEQTLDVFRNVLDTNARYDESLDTYVVECPIGKVAELDAAFGWFVRTMIKPNPKVINNLHIPIVDRQGKSTGNHWTIKK